MMLSQYQVIRLLSRDYADDPFYNYSNNYQKVRYFKLKCATSSFTIGSNNNYDTFLFI
jgi:hypothetical protein